jgi:hypothetical protein
VWLSIMRLTAALSAAVRTLEAPAAEVVALSDRSVLVQ